MKSKSPSVRNPTDLSIKFNIRWWIDAYPDYNAL